MCHVVSPRPPWISQQDPIEQTDKQTKPPPKQVSCSVVLKEGFYVIDYFGHNLE